MNLLRSIADPDYKDVKIRKSKLTRRKNDEIEQEFVAFTKITNGSTAIFIHESNDKSYSGIGGNKSVGFCVGRSCFSWNEEERWWYRDIEIKPPPPKYHTFLMYGEFSYVTKKGEKDLHMVLVRIPGSKINWNKKVVPELRRIANTLGGKEKTYWNVDTYKEIDKSWKNSELPFRRFYWKGNCLVEKRK